MLLADLITHFSFLILFLLFITVLETNVVSSINAFEWLFMTYGIGMYGISLCSYRRSNQVGLGFTVDRLASMQEHGIKCTRMTPMISERSLTLNFYL